MEIHRPDTLAQALEIKAADPAAVPLAGGTDLMVAINFRHTRPAAVLDLTAIAELREWAQDDGRVRVGAGVTYTRLIDELGDLLPGLAIASRTVGSPQIRNRGTVGGNLATASPAGDGLPPLYTGDAVVELASVRGTRRVPVADFITGPKRNCLEPDELIAAFDLPAAAGPQQFAKVGTRNAMVIAVCSVSLALWPEQRRVAACVGSAGPTPLVRDRGAGVHRRRARLGRRAPDPGRRPGALRRARRRVRAADRRRPRDRPLPQPRGRRARPPHAAMGLERVLMRLTINGEPRELDGAWGGESLLYALRERLGLPGSKNACEQGECGSCSVYLDGTLVCSCLVLAAQAEGREVVTVEGLAPAGELHAIQQAFVDAGAVQCGFCTPGLIVASHDLLARDPQPSEADIREALAGNICRCTGYAKIIDAVQLAAGRLAGDDGARRPRAPAGGRRRHRIQPAALGRDPEGARRVRVLVGHGHRGDALGRDAAQPAPARADPVARHQRRRRAAGRARRAHARRRAGPQDLRARVRRPARAGVERRALQGRADRDRRRRPPRDRAPGRGPDRRRVRGARPRLPTPSRR